jgi:two-component system LytT family response regulator
MPVTIFVTGYDEEAVGSFDAHALGYLLKPIDEEGFGRALDRARVRLQETESEALSQKLQGLLRRYAEEGETAPSDAIDRFTVRSRNRIYFVDAADVQWIESEGDYVALHDGDEAHLIRKTMKDLEERLPAEQFLRVHRSYIVNVDYIEELHPLDHGTYRLLMEAGTPLKTSRGYSENVEALIETGS